MKNTTNVFQGGMTQDLAPLSTQQNQLTDALNATFLTYNGNEGILQNDMGNTLIQDANTGNIMGLREGFVPIGMKEHGGVLYIASVNKEGEGEIGTIPSPIIRDQIKEHNTVKIDSYLSGSEGPLESRIISEKFYPGERYIMGLNLNYEDSENNQNDFTQICIHYRDQNFKIDHQNAYYITPTIYTLAGSKPKVNIPKIKGVYDLQQLIQNQTGTRETNPQAQDYYLHPNNTQTKTHYWWLDDVNQNFNIRKMAQDDCIQDYPSDSHPGQLAVKLKLNGIKDFSIIPRRDAKKVPYTIKTVDKDQTVNYKTYIQGFRYSSESSITIKRLEIKASNASTGKSIDVITYNRGELQVLYAINKFPLKKIPQSEETPYIYFQDSLKTKVLLPIKESDTTNDSDIDLGLRTYLITSSREIYNSNYPEENIKSKVVEYDLEHPESFEKDQETGGLCYIDLGGNFDTWIDLEVKYYDQYDGLQGTYNLRFNPYYNDVLDTEGVPNISLTDPIEMGYRGTSNKLTKVLNSSDYPSLKQDFYATLGSLDPSGEMKIIPGDTKNIEEISRFKSTTITLNTSSYYDDTKYGGIVSNNSDPIKIVIEQQLQTILSKIGFTGNPAIDTWGATLNLSKAMGLAGKQVVINSTHLDRWSTKLIDCWCRGKLVAEPVILLANSQPIEINRENNALFAYDKDSKRIKGCSEESSQLLMSIGQWDKYSFQFGDSLPSISLPAFNNEPVFQYNIGSKSCFIVSTDGGGNFPSTKSIKSKSFQYYQKYKFQLLGKYQNRIKITIPEFNFTTTKKITPYIIHKLVQAGKKADLAGKIKTLGSLLKSNISSKDGHIQNIWSELVETAYSKMTMGSCEVAIYNAKSATYTTDEDRILVFNINFATKGSVRLSIQESEISKEISSDSAGRIDPLVIILKSKQAISVELSGDYISAGLYQYSPNSFSSESSIQTLCEYNKNVDENNAIILPQISIYRECFADGSPLYLLDHPIDTDTYYIPTDAKYIYWTYDNLDHPEQIHKWYYQPDNVLSDKTVNSNLNVASAIAPLSALPPSIGNSPLWTEKNVNDYTTNFIVAHPAREYPSHKLDLNGQLEKLTFNQIWS